MKRASLVSQGSLNRIIQSAGEAWKRCDFQPAIEMMERASRLRAQQGDTEGTAMLPTTELTPGASQ